MADEKKEHTRGHTHETGEKVHSPSEKGGATTDTHRSTHKGKHVKEHVKEESRIGEKSEEEGGAVEEKEEIVDEDSGEKEVVEERRPKKIRPHLDERTRRALLLKNEMARKRRKFKHQQWNFSRELERTGWRKPRGKFSKLRHHQVAQGDIVSAGYRGPVLARGLHPSGFSEVLVHNVKDVLKVDPKREAIRIASTVGARKREEIERHADELGIHILNRRQDPEHKIVRVRCTADLEELSPERHTLLIAREISRGQRESIYRDASEKGFKVLNPPGKVKG